MHEVSLAESVLRLIEDAARQQGFSRVSLVRLEIGRLAGIEIEAMRFCFDAVMRGSLAEGARLEIVATQGAGWCTQCSDTVALSDLVAACPRCGGSQVRVTGGTELRVKELEVS